MGIAAIGRTAQRLTLLTALVLTGCTHPGTPAPITADSATLLPRLRSLDPCAFYPGATVADRPLTVLGPVQPLTCAVRIGAPSDRLNARIAVGAAPAGAPAAPDPAWVKHQVVDGVEVTSASARDDPQAPPLDQVVSWSCSLSAHYPDGARITVFADSGPHDDACRIGEALIRQAIRVYPTQPQAANGRFPSTVLTGADPCAVADRLRPAHRVDWNPDEVTVTSCGLHVDGGPLVDVSFGYEDPETLAYAGSPSTRHGHRLFESLPDGITTVVVGDEFRVDDKPLVPTVTIVDLSKSPDLLRLVGDAVADRY